MSIINSNFRLTGLASGLDTDQMVQDLMSVERVPLTKLEQKRQLAEWRQEAYREFTNALRGFKEKFFDVTQKTNYLLSDNTYKVFNTTSTGEEYVTAGGTSEAQVGTHTVKVLQLATADTAVSASSVSKPITGEVSNFSLEGKSITVNLDGVTKVITLGNYDDLDGLINDEENGLQKLVDDAFGTGKIQVQNVAGKLEFSTEGGAGEITLYSGLSESSDALTYLGIEPGTSNRISKGETLVGLADQFVDGLTFNASGNISFTMNDVQFTFSKDDSLTDVMQTINNNVEAGVRLSYDEATDKFTLTAKQSGAGDNIRLQEAESTFFAAIGIDAAEPIKSENQGVDAIAEIDGVLVTRSSNTFTVNGVEYTLRKVHDTENPDDTITLEQDIDAVVDTIETFVEEYNELVDMFSDTLSEEYDRDYLPLSDDEKEAMTEDEIEQWEEKAKTGLLRNDSILEKIQSDMRMALLEPVEGIGINLSSIGISSKSYQDKGKLYIDEYELREAIRQRPDEVMNLFKQQSESVPSYTRTLSADERSARYQEQGLFYRLSDIIEDQISIFRDSDGRKGILLEKAGIEGDTSQYNSSLSEDISDYDERITELYNKLIEKEENYYSEFTQLETYMNQMNSQMDWLVSQLGSM